jgi:hypothetical protein
MVVVDARVRCVGESASRVRGEAYRKEAIKSDGRWIREKRLVKIVKCLESKEKELRDALAKIGDRLAF